VSRTIVKYQLQKKNVVCKIEMHN